MRALIVREPFSDYAKGQAIRDPEEMQKVTAAGQAHFCTPTELADDFFEEPEPEPAPATKPAAAPAPAVAPPALIPPAAPAAPNA